MLKINSGSVQHWMALYNKSKKITDYYLVDIDVEQQEIEVD
jgi:hypothetical protein